MKPKFPDKAAAMARVSINIPENFTFKTELTVRITDINNVSHVGHDSFISFLNETRKRFLDHLRIPTVSDDQKGLIIADLAVCYKNQAFYGDRICIEAGAEEFNRYGCDIFYRMTNAQSGDIILLAKTGVVFFDYPENRVAPIPESYVSKLKNIKGGIF